MECLNPTAIPAIVPKVPTAVAILIVGRTVAAAEMAPSPAVPPAALLAA